MDEHLKKFFWKKKYIDPSKLYRNWSNFHKNTTGTLISIEEREVDCILYDTSAFKILIMLI